MLNKTKSFAVITLCICLITSCNADLSRSSPNDYEGEYNTTLNGNTGIATFRFHEENGVLMQKYSLEVRKIREEDPTFEIRHVPELR